MPGHGHSNFPQPAQAIGDPIKRFDFNVAVEQLDPALQACTDSVVA